MLFRSHPITEDLRWKELQEERIIKAPVPAYKPLDDDGTVIVPAEQATEQCFRIYSVSVDTANHEVTVEARHISYDFMGNMCGRLTTQMGTYVVNALAKMRNTLFTPDNRILATNIVRRVNLGKPQLCQSNQVSARSGYRAGSAFPGQAGAEQRRFLSAGQ